MPKLKEVEMLYLFFVKKIYEINMTKHIALLLYTRGGNIGCLEYCEFK